MRDNLVLVHTFGFLDSFEISGYTKQAQSGLVLVHTFGFLDLFEISGYTKQAQECRQGPRCTVCWCTGHTYEMCPKSKNVRVFLGLSWTEKESPVPLYTPAEKETGCLLMMQGKTRGNPEGGGDLRDGDTGVDEGIAMRALLMGKVWGMRMRLVVPVGSGK